MAVCRKFAGEGRNEGLEECSEKEGRRWRDYQSTVMAAVIGGNFIKIDISLASPNGRRVLLCLPEGEDSRGWQVFANALEKMVGATRQGYRSSCLAELAGDGRVSCRTGMSYGVAGHHLC